MSSLAKAFVCNDSCCQPRQAATAPGLRRLLSGSRYVPMRPVFVRTVTAIDRQIADRDHQGKG